MPALDLLSPASTFGAMRSENLDHSTPQWNKLAPAVEFELPAGDLGEIE